MTSVRISAADGRTCRRCAATLCLTARVGSGDGHRTVPLCPACDRANPHARGIIEYLAEHRAVRPQDREHVSELVNHWLGSVEAYRSAPSGLAEAAAAWWSARRG